MLLDQPIPEEDESAGDFEYENNASPGTKRQASKVFKAKELLRTRYGINTMDLENIQLVEYKVVEIIDNQGG